MGRLAERATCADVHAKGPGSVCWQMGLSFWGEWGAYTRCTDPGDLWGNKRRIKARNTGFVCVWALLSHISFFFLSGGFCAFRTCRKFFVFFSSSKLLKTCFLWRSAPTPLISICLTGLERSDDAEMLPVYLAYSSLWCCRCWSCCYCHSNHGHL